MKKIAVLIAAAFLTIGTCFADTFAGGEKLVENFFNNGTYIKFIIDDNNITYVYKHTGVWQIRIDEDDFRVISTTTLKESVYELSRYNVVNDSNGNIIVSKKKK